MTTLKETIKLDFNSWNIKLTENERRNVLKLYVKLNKEDSLSFKNFMSAVKPTDVADNDFIKAIFAMGVEQMEKRLVSAVESRLSASGSDVSGMGSVEFVETLDEEPKNA